VLAETILAQGPIRSLPLDQSRLSFSHLILAAQARIPSPDARFSWLQSFTSELTTYYSRNNKKGHLKQGGLSFA
jgi:hypothetical protein